MVIAMFDSTDVHHAATMANLQAGIHAGSEYVMPASVLSEVLVGVARHSEAAVDIRRQELIRLFGMARVIDANIAVVAAKLRAHHRSLRLPDALVIATGIVDEVDTILTADKRWESVDERVEVLTSGP